MIDPQHIDDPLIEAATRPLADNPELRLAAAGYLQAMRKPAPQAEQVAIARWAEADAGKRGGWMWALWGLVMVLALLVAWTDWLDVMDAMNPGWDRGTRENTRDEFEARIAGDLTKEQKLLMFGDLSTKDLVRRKEALWKSEPDSPVFLPEYFNELPEIPGELLARANTIDPDNAWFTFAALSMDSRECVERVYSGGGFMKGKSVAKPPSWKIKDPAVLERIAMAMKAARFLTKWESYYAERMRRRIPFLKDGNIAQRKDSRRYLFENVGAMSSGAYALDQACCAIAWQHADRGDVDSFRGFSSDVEHFIRLRSSGEPFGLVDEMFLRNSTKTIAKGLMEAAGKLGLKNEEVRWREILSDIEALDRHRSTPVFPAGWIAYEPGVKTGVLRSGDITSMARYAQNPPSLTDSDICPGRLVDHEFASRLCAMALVLVLPVIAGLIPCFRFRHSLMIRRLASRFHQLLRPIDWLWICGLGLIGPLMFVLAVNRLTPFGGRDFGLLGSFWILPAAHFLALLLYWLLLPPCLIRWRLRKRAAMFADCRVGIGLEWVPIVVLAVFVPVVGWAATTGVVPQLWVVWFDWYATPIVDRNSEAPLWIAAALLAVTVVWMLVSAGASFLANGRGRLECMPVTRAMQLVAAAAALLALALIPVFKQCEQHWYAQDRLAKFDVTQPGWSRYEYQVAVQMRKELRGILEAPR